MRPPVRTPPFIVALAGGSGSGKSTLAHAVAGALSPDHVSILCQDAYYRDRRDLTAEARVQLDYDAPDAFDQPRFLSDLARLRRGEPIAPPRYCFVSHRRLGDGDRLEPGDIVLVEGILLLHDAEVRRAFDFAIFVEAPASVRLSRRILRDTVERGRTAEPVRRQYARTVAPAHVRYVEPTRIHADLVLANTGRIEPLADVAAALIRDRASRRNEEWNGARASAS
jgi:uridine kinase